MLETFADHMGPLSKAGQLMLVIRGLKECQKALLILGGLEEGWSTYAGHMRAKGKLWGLEDGWSAYAGHMRPKGRLESFADPRGPGGRLVNLCWSYEG